MSLSESMESEWWGQSMTNSWIGSSVYSEQHIIWQCIQVSSILRMQCLLIQTNLVYGPHRIRLTKWYMKIDWWEKRLIQCIFHTSDWGTFLWSISLISSFLCHPSLTCHSSLARSSYLSLIEYEYNYGNR